MYIQIQTERYQSVRFISNDVSDIVAFSNPLLEREGNGLTPSNDVK